MGLRRRRDGGALRLSRRRGRSDGAERGADALLLGDGHPRRRHHRWDDSPFSVGRGFDIVVLRTTMTVEFITNHGPPTGNDNIDGDAVLEAILEVIEGLD